MLTILRDPDQPMPGTTEFIEIMTHPHCYSGLAGRPLFAPGRELVITRAPGRLDVMGGIGDYSGSLVLQLPLQEATFVALQPQSSDQLEVVSLGAKPDSLREFSMPMADFYSEGQPISYEQGRTYFLNREKDRWSTYVAGVFLVLMRDYAVRFPGGATILIHSNVPEGRGVSSSAALEVAAMKAVAAAYGIDLAPEEIARLCQKLENLVVGAPCGIMDQMTATLGAKDHLLSLLCQPAEVRGTIPIPDDIRFWGIDSGISHQVSGTAYSRTRTAAFMGYRIIAQQAGLDVRDTADGSVIVEDTVWNGYLANIAPSFFEERFASHLPANLTGKEFRDSYGETTDIASRIHSNENYPVRVATAHPVYEHLRVRLFSRLLRAEPNRENRILMGELMYQSHHSYSRCGLGSEATDKLVKLSRKLGPAEGIYGARITGGGSGGTVAVLADRHAEDSIQRLAQEYKETTGHPPSLLSDSSDGAEAFNFMKLKL